LGFNKGNKTMEKDDVVTLFIGIFIGLILLSMYLGRIDWDISASIIIAIFALALTVWQGMSVRTHNIISVKPYLRFSCIRGNDSWELKLDNSGLGPAFIHYIEPQLNDKPVDADEFTEYFENNFPDYAGEVKVALVGSAIPANQSITIVSIGFSQNNSTAKQLTKIVGMRVKYTSAYGEEFIQSSCD
jgi:hypothetical protein